MTVQGPQPDPLGFLADEIEGLKRQNLYRPLRVLSSPQGAAVVVDDRHVISLSSNNYLGLATHPRLKEAAIAADFGRLQYFVGPRDRGLLGQSDTSERGDGGCKQKAKSSHAAPHV